MRIGHGYDAHPFSDARALVLGGVLIPQARGLAAHSDGDALLHALCDALLGAAALDDIGIHFPDTDARHADRDSREFLRAVRDMLQARGLRILNVDLTILAEEPKLASHLPAMRESLGGLLELPPGRVGLKATTNESMGFIGRREGIAVHAVVLLDEAQQAPAPDHDGS